MARNIALRQLTMGPRTRAQLEDKLAARECDPEVARVVLDRLTEVGLIDDVAFAEMFIRSGRATKGSAKRSLAHGLRRKGVPDEIIDDALAGIDPQEEAEQARALVRKRLRSLHGLDAQVQTRRLAGMLARKGYGPGVSYSVIKEELAVAPEHRRD